MLSSGPVRVGRSERMPSPPAWKSLLHLLAPAAAVVVAADLGLARLSPPPPALIEVEDGVADYEATDPDTLILGSSHTRSFLPVAETLGRESGQRVVLVATESGTFLAYDWVLQHRLRPLIEESRDGAPKRRRLSRAILVTTFFDTCPPEVVGAAGSLPARGWAIGDFAGDLLRNGLTDYNRNFLQFRLKRWFRGSVLVQNRGFDRINEALMHRLRPPGPGAAERERREAIDSAARHLIEQYRQCDTDDERRALRDLVAWFQARRVELVIVSFPLMPGIVTPEARRTTLARYSSYLATLAREPGVRVVDMTFGAPLVDDDFMADLDHVTVPANRKFAAWALSGPLALLRAPPPGGAWGAGR